MNLHEDKNHFHYDALKNEPSLKIEKLTYSKISSLLANVSLFLTYLLFFKKRYILSIYSMVVVK